MSINMSYVKFENTLAAMRECFNGEWINYANLSNSEKEAFDELVKLCTTVSDDYDAHNG